MSYPFLTQTKGGYSRTSEDSVSIVILDSGPWPCAWDMGDVVSGLVLERHLVLLKEDNSEGTVLLLSSFVFVLLFPLKTHLISYLRFGLQKAYIFFVTSVASGKAGKNTLFWLYRSFGKSHVIDPTITNWSRISITSYLSRPVKPKQSNGNTEV